MAPSMIHRKASPRNLADHVQKEFSTYSWLMQPMLERCGFEILESSLSGVRCMGRTYARKPVKSRFQDEPGTALATMIAKFPSTVLDEPFSMS